MVWVIICSVVIAIALIIFIILMLPVNLHIENVSNGDFDLYIKILGFKLKSKNKSDSKAKQTTEKFLGVSNLKDLKSIKKSAKEGTLSRSVTEFSDTVTSIFKQLLKLLKKCTVKKLYIKIVNAGDDAAKAAIGYGASCAAVYTLVGYIEGVARVKKNAKGIDLSCRYDTAESEFNYHIAISVRLYRILVSLFKIAKQKAERQS